MKETFLPGIALVFLTGLAVPNVARPAAVAPVSAEADLDVVLVTGEQPGPALWKVSSGDHHLWILGEVSPLPRKVKWRSRQFESLLGNSQEVILHDSAGSTKGIQAAQLARANELPAGQSLRDIVSPDLYARIETVAKIYGISEPLEDLSPPIVGSRFANASLKTLDLRVLPLQLSVESLARKAKISITTYSTQHPDVDIPFDERLQMIRSSATAVCPLERIVRLLEDGGSGLRRLANAWAVGDIESLRRLVPEYGLFTDGFRSSACPGVAPADRKRFEEYLSPRTARWVAEAERALRENETTLAVVPMPELFELDGYLAALRARGYEVLDPE